MVSVPCSTSAPWARQWYGLPPYSRSAPAKKDACRRERRREEERWRYSGGDSRTSGGGEGPAAGSRRVGAPWQRRRARVRGRGRGRGAGARRAVRARARHSPRPAPAEQRPRCSLWEGVEVLGFWPRGEAVTSKAHLRSSRSRSTFSHGAAGVRCGPASPRPCSRPRGAAVTHRTMHRCEAHTTECCTPRSARASTRRCAGPAAARPRAAPAGQG